MEQSLHDSLDGSHTVFSSKYNAHYHSIYGALDESIHVFIMAGLFYFHRKNRKELSILEMGFGTGLNAYLTLLESGRLDMSISYTTLESDPVEDHILHGLNYPQLLGQNDDESFPQLHSCPWESEQRLTAKFKLLKKQCQLEDFSPDSKYDLIYYDAFAPSCQSHLWEKDIHEKLYHALNPTGALVTYCTQGQFKRNLKAIGYRLEILNGPGKKREMLRAIKA